jgi:hypothetical protein
MGDVDGAYVAANDAYRMVAESLLACQGLRVTGGDGSHMAVEDAVSAQFAADIPAFAKPTQKSTLHFADILAWNLLLSHREPGMSLSAGPRVAHVRSGVG